MSPEIMAESNLKRLAGSLYFTADCMFVQCPQPTRMGL